MVHRARLFRTKVASVSWKHLLVTLLAIFYILEQVAMSYSRDAMYSPVNAGGGSKQRMHDDMLSAARAFVEDHLNPGGGQNQSMPSLYRLHHPTDEGPPPRRSVIVLTAQRKKRYLDVLLWSLLMFNEPQQLNKTSLTILNTERPPQHNLDLTRWQRIRPELQVRNATVSLSDQQSSSWVRRGVSDYVEALEVCQEELSLWCIIIEEDSVLSRLFLDQFQNTVETKLNVGRIRQQHIGMVKLFVSDHWDGFSTSWGHVLEMAFVASLSVVFAVCLFLLLPSSSTASTSRTTQNIAFRKCAVTCTISFTGFYLTCRLLERQVFLNLFEPNYVHLDPIRITAGTVGIAFPQSAIPHVREYLREKQQGNRNIDPIDVALNGWLESSSFRALRTRPSLVQHLGAFSSANYKNQGNFQEMKQDSSFVF